MLTLKYVPRIMSRIRGAYMRCYLHTLLLMPSRTDTLVFVKERQMTEGNHIIAGRTFGEHG